MDSILFSQSYQYGGDNVGSVLQTVELLQRWPVDGCVHVASLLVPIANLETQSTVRLEVIGLCSSATTAVL